MLCFECLMFLNSKVGEKYSSLGKVVVTPDLGQVTSATIFAPYSRALNQKFMAELKQIGKIRLPLVLLVLDFPAPQMWAPHHVCEFPTMHQVPGIRY